jgi:hypothetical protein
MRQLLKKVTLEPGRTHVIGAYEPGFGVIIEGDLESYSFFVVKGRPSGSEPLRPPILVIESGELQITATEGRSCLMDDNGLLKIRNDRVDANINIGYFFVPYKNE